MEEPIVETEIIETENYMEWTILRRARFPTTNGVEYCIESANDSIKAAIFPEKQANTDPLDGLYVPKQWNDQHKAIRRKYHMTVGDVQALRMALGKDVSYENDEQSGDDDETARRKLRNREAQKKACQGGGSRGPLENAWIRANVYPDELVDMTGRFFESRHREKLADGSEIWVGDSGFRFNGRGDLMGEGVNGDFGVLVKVESLGEWFWKYRENQEGSRDVDPGRILKFFQIRMEIAEAGVEASRTLLAEDEEHEAELQRMLDFANFPEGTDEREEAVSRGYMSKRLVERDLRQIEQLRVRRAERLQAITTADNQLPFYQELYEAENQRQDDYMRKIMDGP